MHSPRELQMSFKPTRGLRAGKAAALVSLGLALALAVTGCQSAVNQQDAADGKPKRGGTLRIVQGADVQPATLMAQNNPNFSLTRTVFNSLVDYNHKTLKPEPQL